MTREEILRAAQNDKSEMGEYEKIVEKKAVSYGAALGIAVCLVMVIIEMLVVHRVDWGKPALILVIGGYTDIYEGFRNKIGKKAIWGIIEMAVAIILLFVYIGEFF